MRVIRSGRVKAGEVGEGPLVESNRLSHLVQLEIHNS